MCYTCYEILIHSLTELGKEFDRGGDRFSIAKELNTCMDQLVKKGAVTERSCCELRTLIHTRL